MERRHPGHQGIIPSLPQTETPRPLLSYGQSAFGFDKAKRLVNTLCRPLQCFGAMIGRLLPCPPPSDPSPSLCV